MLELIGNVWGKVTTNGVFIKTCVQKVKRGAVDGTAEVLLDVVDAMPELIAEDTAIATKKAATKAMSIILAKEAKERAVAAKKNVVTMKNADKATVLAALK